MSDMNITHYMLRIKNVVFILKYITHQLFTLSSQ